MYVELCQKKATEDRGLLHLICWTHSFL